MNIIEIGKKIVKEEDFDRLNDLFDEMFKIYNKELKLKDFKELFNNEEILDIIEKYYRLYMGYLFGNE